MYLAAGAICIYRIYCEKFAVCLNEGYNIMDFDMSHIVVKAKLWPISSDTHQLRYIPKHHFIIIIIIVDMVLRHRKNFKHGK